eukprot:Opistho-1_new@64280
MLVDKAPCRCRVGDDPRIVGDRRRRRDRRHKRIGLPRGEGRGVHRIALRPAMPILSFPPDPLQHRGKQMVDDQLTVLVAVEQPPIEAVALRPPGHQPAVRIEHRFGARKPAGQRGQVEIELRDPVFRKPPARPQIDIRLPFPRIEYVLADAQAYQHVLEPGLIARVESLGALQVFDLDTQQARGAYGELQLRIGGPRHPQFRTGADHPVMPLQRLAQIGLGPRHLALPPIEIGQLETQLDLVPEVPDRQVGLALLQLSLDQLEEIESVIGLLPPFELVVVDLEEIVDPTHLRPTPFPPKEIEQPHRARLC